MKLTLQLVLFLFLLHIIFSPSYGFKRTGKKFSRGSVHKPVRSNFNHGRREPKPKASTKHFAHDVKTKSGLTNIYNERVTKVERMRRPMSSSGGSKIPFVPHQGVRVTTDKGNQYLVHKGPNFGKSSQNVVVDAKHMSGKWETIGSSRVKSKKTVSDFVKSGGKNYNVLTDNCIQAAKRMYKTGRK